MSTDMRLGNVMIVVKTRCLLGNSRHNPDLNSARFLIGGCSHVNLQSMSVVGLTLSVQVASKGRELTLKKRRRGKDISSCAQDANHGNSGTEHAVLSK